VNSSSAYKKEEVDVAGAPRVKKVTKVGVLNAVAKHCNIFTL